MKEKSQSRLIDSKKGLAEAVISTITGAALVVLLGGCGVTAATGYPGVVPVYQHKVYSPPGPNSPIYLPESRQEYKPRVYSLD